MRKALILVSVLVIFKCSAYAGFLAGNASPLVSSSEQFATDISTSVVMFKTPFSSACLTARYAWNDRLSFMGKWGVGEVDYSTISGFKLTSAPVIYGGGMDFVLGGARSADYYAFFCEYETAAWGINNASVSTNELLAGIDLVFKASNGLRTKYRIGLNNFNAGTENEDNIDSSVKYSLSTQIQYNFNNNYNGLLEGGVYIGDKVGGLISYFGLGIGFNS